ncbi:MAG: glycosyltransferase family 2 protein [Dehalococcoidia bacterium]|nr:glycosyltransferase family 2 protein [Dehalococcoidia bacterium]
MRFPIPLTQARPSVALAAGSVDGAARVAGPSERVVVVPVYDERATVIGVLDDVVALGFERLLIVDDGSTDGSSELLDEWAVAHPSARVIHLPENRGKAAALRAAWDVLRRDLERGDLGPGTAVIGIDADRQHDLRQVGALVDRLETLGVDAVIAQRDLSYHRPFKRFGNHVMAAIGSVLGGGRLHDVESGFRVVRLGPLLHATEFYRGRRYSEASELVVVLKRLGYRVDNDYVVQVPVARSRTHLSDAASHIVAMTGAWFRVVCWSTVPQSLRWRVNVALAAVLLIVFAGFLGMLLTHPVFLGDDSAQSYGHVWFIAKRLYAGEWLPLHMASLESGRAYTLPYGALPWIPTALLRPLLGDWAVTASMGVGVALLFLGIWRWLPRTATPLMTALVLLNWQLWNGILQFQLLTIWALAFACLAAAEYDRSRPRRGTALAFAAFLAHPLMGGCALAVTSLAAVERERRVPWRRAAWLCLAAALAAPAIWMFVTTPSVSDAAKWSPLVTGQVLGRRLSILAWPWLIQRVRPVTVRLYAPIFALGSVLLVLHLGHANPRNLRWESLPRFPDYLAAGRLDRTQRYRVLTTSNQEDGMTQLLQAGGSLAQEYFDESVYRHSFRNAEEYRCFLERKRATRVLVNDLWVRLHRTNEVQLLDELVARGEAQQTFHGSRGTLEYTISAVTPAACSSHSS